VTSIENTFENAPEHVMPSAGSPSQVDSAGHPWRVACAVDL